MKGIEGAGGVVAQLDRSVDRRVEIRAFQLFTLVVYRSVTIARHVFQNITRFTADDRGEREEKEETDEHRCGCHRHRH